MKAMKTAIALMLLLGVTAADLGHAQPARATKQKSSEPAATASKDQGRAAYERYLAHRSGQGVPKDNKAAISWLKQSAEAGNRQAQKTLSLHYERGDGVRKDRRLANLWRMKSQEAAASHQGHRH